MPSHNPSLVPSPGPTDIPTPRPTYDWETLEPHVAEIKLDQMVNQSCAWHQLRCGHCLDILRIAIFEDYTEQAIEPEEITKEETLLEQYDHRDECECIGGSGEEITDNGDRKLQIDIYNDTASITLEEKTGDDPDDFILTIGHWNYSGSNDKENIDADEDCHLEFYVNRNTFFGIMARSVLKVDFDLTQMGYYEDDLEGLLKDQFTNDSHLDEATNITVSASYSSNYKSRRLLQRDNPEDVSITVLIFTDSAEEARTAKNDLEKDEQLPDGWKSELQNLIQNKTGESPSVDNVEYALISPDQIGASEAEGPTIPNLDVLSMEKLPWLIIIIAVGASLIALAVIAGIIIVYCKKKRKAKMRYTKPKITQDAISEIDHTSACEDGEGEESDNEQRRFVPHLAGIGVSHRVVTDDSDDLGGDVITGASGGISRFDSHEESSSPGMNDRGYHKSDMETVSMVSSFSAKTSILNFDLESNLDIDEILPQMINKVCTSNRTRLIDDDDLIIENMIGKGHFGQVYVGKYDGNKVAIKTFPDLDIHNIIDDDTENKSNFNKSSSLLKPKIERAKSPSIEKMISRSFRGKNGGYNPLDNDDDDDAKAFALDNNNRLTDKQNAALRKKIYARKKEIYSEVVLASSLPLHPNLVQILGITQNPLKIVMTYYEGGNLKDFIYRDRRKLKYDSITLNSIIVLMQKIADGILFLHNSKIVHRDIAARNVLLGHIDTDGQITENTQVVLSDFGMTRCMVNDEHIDSVYGEKKTKQKIGPIKWMAPESISKQKYSYKSDVYMFAITMFEIMHGKQPYTEPRYSNFTLPILATKIVKKSIRPIIDQQQELHGILLGNVSVEKTVIPEINKLMKRCWHKSPQDRPTMLSILHTLNSIYDSMLGLSFE